MAKSIGAPEIEEVLAARSDENIKDVDPAAWLEDVDSGEVGEVVIDGARLKIAALSEEEVQNLFRVCTRPDPTNPSAPPKLDSMRFRLAVIATSLSKANGVQVVPDSLKRKKFGTLTRLQDAVMDISGMNDQGTKVQAQTFFG